MVRPNFLENRIMAIHECKKAPWGVYRVCDVFLSSRGEEIALCQDWDGYFELPARTVRHHRNITADEYARRREAEIRRAFGN